MIPPSRPTTCSGIVALLAPVLTAAPVPVVVAGEENNPPAPASHTVTVTLSPTSITGSVEILWSPNWA